MKYIQKAKKIGLGLATSLLLFSNTTAFAYSASFNQSTFFDNGDLYNLPAAFQGKTREQSINIIQQILARDNGKLSTLKVTIAESDADFVSKNAGLAANLGKTVSVAELIWMIAREDLRIGTWSGMPIGEYLNPVFILTLIQKESGLVYGTCSYSTCFDQSVDYRIARATGYGCSDGTGCKDWALGFFAQVFYGTRWYKAYTKFCQAGFSGFQGQTFKTGNTVNVYEGPVTLGTDVVCATYHYTPHDYPQKSFYQVFRNINDMAAAISSQIVTPTPIPVVTAPPPAPVVAETPQTSAPVPNISVSINNITTSDPAPLLSGKIDGQYDQLKLQFGNESEINIAPGANGEWSYKIKYPKQPGTYDIKIIAIKGGQRFVDTTTNEVTIQRAAPAPVVNNLAEFVPPPKREESVVKEETKKEAVPVLVNPAVIENAPAPTIPVEEKKPEETAKSIEEVKEVVKTQNPLSNIFNQSRFKNKKEMSREKISIIENEVNDSRENSVLKTMAGTTILGVSLFLLRKIKRK